MSNVYETSVEYQEDVDSVVQFCEDLYDNEFSSYLSSIRDLYIRMQSKVHVVTDEELESILTELPMNLFMASEGLNSLKLRLEVTKLKNKEKKDEIRNRIRSELEDSDLSSSAKQEILSRSQSEELAEYEILVVAYNTVISRVETEMSFARELIMGCKKIWDARRSAEESNPVSEIVKKDVQDLPEYRRDISKTYVR